MKNALNEEKKNCSGTTHTSKIGIIWFQNELSIPTSYIRMHDITVARNQAHIVFTKFGQSDLAVQKSSIWLIPTRGVASVALPHVQPIRVTLITVTPLIYDSGNALQAVHVVLRWAMNNQWGLTWAVRDRVRLSGAGSLLQDDCRDQIFFNLGCNFNVTNN